MSKFYLFLNLCIQWQTWLAGSHKLVITSMKTEIRIPAFSGLSLLGSSKLGFKYTFNVYCCFKWLLILLFIFVCLCSAALRNSLFQLISFVGELAGLLSPMYGAIVLRKAS